MSDDLIKALQKEAREDAEIITRLRAENERLREALEPFADKATQWEGQPERQITVMLSECRRARAALEGVMEPQTGGGNGNQ